MSKFWELQSMAMRTYIQDKGKPQQGSCRTRECRSALATDLMEFMLDAEPGDMDNVEFNEDGTSTSGYFDVFPAEADADVVQGLQITEDMYESTN